MPSTQIIFMKGKEKALDALFDSEEDKKGTFGYLALGYDPEQKGFDNPTTENTDNGFKEIETIGLKRIPLQKSSIQPEEDTSSGKVIVRYEGVLTSTYYQEGNINQLAVVNNETKDPTTDIFYSAALFRAVYKDSTNSLTFVIGFQL